jgi:YD repeat-containing protein
VDGDNNGSALCDVGAYEVGAFPVTTIAYTYDPLYRLTGATYSTGNAFSYALDAAGNTLTRTQTLAGQLVTTTYTYNAANELVTAKDSNDPTTWYYTYNPNGRLTDITPNGTAPANGARRFTYSVAGYLIQTETYTGTAYQLQAQMHYTGGLFYCASRPLPYPTPPLCCILRLRHAPFRTRQTGGDNGLTPAYGHSILRASSASPSSPREEILNCKCNFWL